MWAEESVFYQIYPLGFCGAPRENDGVETGRIRKIAGWAEHIQRLGADAVYLSPVFESDSHGYDTRDYRKVDCRLGSNRDFAQVCRTLHEHGIRVVLDGVRFWAEEFGIDGLRLDVAYCLDRDFLRRLRQFTDALKPDFFLVGETLHGDYNQWVGDGLLHSCTNGETMLLRVRFIAEFICTEI